MLDMSTGRPLKLIDEAIYDRLAPAPQALDVRVEGHPASIRRLLDREQPDQRN